MRVKWPQAIAWIIIFFFIAVHVLNVLDKKKVPTVTKQPDPVTIEQPTVLPPLPLPPSKPKKYKVVCVHKGKQTICHCVPVE